MNKLAPFEILVFFPFCTFVELEIGLFQAKKGIEETKSSSQTVVWEDAVLSPFIFEALGFLL